MRVFFAIKIPQHVSEKIEVFTEQLNNKNHFLGDQALKVRWFDPKKFHVTLLFLGNISSNQLPFVIERAELVKKDFKRFALSFHRVELFSSRKDHYILALKPDFSQPLNDLALSLKRSIDSLNMISLEQRPYHPHLTLARIKSDHPIALTKDILVPDFSFEVTGFTLFKSSIDAKGATYHCLAQF